jgi:hypothetical protein
VISKSDAIDTGLVNDNELLQMEQTMNKDDQDLRSVFIEVGLIDRDDQSDIEEEQPIHENNQPEDDYDYDVDDLLKDALSY